MNRTNGALWLQPSLLDRLTNDHPGHRNDPPETRFISEKGLRESVLRELRWLFNAAGPLRDIDPARYPHAAKSVLNYGLPCFVGGYAASIDMARLQASIRQAIVRFEPRILPSSIEIEPDPASHVALSHISLIIRGLLWFRPAPLAIVLRTQIDLEQGGVTVNDAGA